MGKLKRVLLAASVVAVAGGAVLLVSTADDHSKDKSIQTSQEGSATKSEGGEGPAAPSQPNFGELQIHELELGRGKMAKQGQTVSVHYVGTVSGGQKYFSTRDAKRPVKFKLGANQVIAGLDRGVESMRVGGKRKLVVPSTLAYGDSGAGPMVPPHSDLILEVELMRIE
jgi:FKBP-type peptidyl-prolyl cis-trans isomerase FkpA